MTWPTWYRCTWRHAWNTDLELMKIHGVHIPPDKWETTRVMDVHRLECGFPRLLLTIFPSEYSYGNEPGQRVFICGTIACSTYVLEQIVNVLNRGPVDTPQEFSGIEFLNAESNTLTAESDTLD